MKILFTFLLALLSVFTYGQNPPQKIPANYQFQSVGADSSFRLPKHFATNTVFLDSGMLAFRVSDSTMWLYTGHRWIGPFIIGATNGLNDSSGYALLGGQVHKPTMDTIKQGNQLGWYFPGNSIGFHPNFWFGQGGQNYSTQNGFFPPVCFCDSLSYVGNNSPFLTMESVDFPGPNGVLFLNYQGQVDSPQFDERVFTPTHNESTFSLDLNGLPNTNPYTSAYDIFFYGDLSGGQGFGMTGSNFAAWHNGPCCYLNPPYGMTFMQDQYFNVLIGPGRDSANAGPFGIGYAIPYGRLDIRPSATNTSRIGIIEQDPTDTNKLAGPLVVGATMPGVTGPHGWVDYPHYTTTQKLAIPSPVEGRQVYDITLHQMSYWNGTTWINF
jgi:hypothetical protein